jgi:glycosyltransferase involved in cell wall biosynthesis
MAHIVHLTTVHDPRDNRIFHRECVSLARAGHTVTLVAEGGQAETVAGVRMLPVSRSTSRLGRMTFGVLRVLWKALRLRADVYHFHDPELIPAGLLLRLCGRKVVYDVHEDYRTAIMEREYLPLWLRGGISRAFSLLERAAGRCFRVVLAERYYAERWPRGTPVLNYAEFPNIPASVLASRPVSGPMRLIYTGNVKSYRGAFTHVALLDFLPRAELFLVGRCSRELAAELRTRAGTAVDRLHLEGIGHMVPFERITACYTQEQWTAALAVFPPSPHTLRKELTKIFEYMAYAIPVVCADFPNLRRIVEGEGCGLCVDPQDPNAAAAAIGWLASHPDKARAMGQRGREAARREYNWDTQAQRLVQLYDDLLSSTER